MEYMIKRIFLFFIFVSFASCALLAQSEQMMISSDPSSMQNNPQPQELFVMVEEMPVFHYGNCFTTNDSFLKYVMDSIHFSSVDCMGKMYIRFIVEADSTISHVNVAKGLENCPDFKTDVERTISLMPKWIPGKQGGREVRVRMTMPVNFTPN